MVRRKAKTKVRPRRRKRGASASADERGAAFAMWGVDDGVQALVPGTPPDQRTLEQMTRAFQEQIRKSPLWDQMVREFGPEKAEELLKQFRAELR